MMLDCEDGSRIEGRSVVPNLESGFYLEKVPETLEELKQVINDNVNFNYADSVGWERVGGLSGKRYDRMVLLK